MAGDVLRNKVASLERWLERIRTEYQGDPRRLDEPVVEKSVVLNLQRAAECAIDLVLHLAAAKRLGEFEQFAAAAVRGPPS